jgi:hypothetical protein
MKRGASRPILRSCRNCYVRIDVGFCTQRGQRVQNYKERGRRPWVKPRQCISTARIAMRFITLSEPRLDQRPFIVRVPCRVCDAPLPGRDVFFCGTRCALTHGRVKAPSGQNQLRAKSVHRLTDTFPVQASPLVKSNASHHSSAFAPGGTSSSVATRALARTSCGHYLLRNAVVSGLKEWRLARRATECFLRSWKSAPALYSCFYVPKPSVPILIMT